VLHRKFEGHSRKLTDPGHWTLVGILADGTALVLERPPHLNGTIVSTDPHALTEWTEKETFHLYPDGSSTSPSYREHKKSPVWIVTLDLAIRLANAFRHVVLGLGDNATREGVEQQVVEWQARLQAKVVNPLLVKHPPPVNSKGERLSGKPWKHYTVNVDADLELATPLLVSS
jgi:hypothetical protein